MDSAIPGSIEDTTSGTTCANRNKETALQKLQREDLQTLQQLQGQDKLPGDFREILDFLAKLNGDEDFEVGRDCESYDEELQGRCVDAKSKQAQAPFFRFKNWRNRVSHTKVDALELQSPSWRNVNSHRNASPLLA
jgi:hypothetical protein